MGPSEIKKHPDALQIRSLRADSDRTFLPSSCNFSKAYPGEIRSHFALFCECAGGQYPNAA
eukprot:2138132-Rhodomonas_salina.2